MCWLYSASLPLFFVLISFCWRSSGHEFSFSLPSLVYPEGRFYVDIDVSDLRLYMRSLGIPEDYLKLVLPRGRYSPNTGGPAIPSNHSESSGTREVSSNISLNHFEKGRESQQFVPNGQSGFDVNAILSSEEFLSAQRSQAPFRRLKIAVKDHKAPRREHVVDQPFRPLDAPLPLHATPKVQWVVNFVGDSNYRVCQQRARRLVENKQGRAC